MFKSEEYNVVRNYLLRAVNRPAFWKEVEQRDKYQAVSELVELPTGKEALTVWIEKWLTENQLAKLRSALTSARQRGKGVDVTLSNEAHELLKYLAKGPKKITLSEVIVKHLTPVVNRKRKRQSLK